MLGPPTACPNKNKPKWLCDVCIHRSSQVSTQRARAPTTFFGHTRSPQKRGERFTIISPFSMIPIIEAPRCENDIFEESHRVMPGENRVSRLGNVLASF